MALTSRPWLSAVGLAAITGSRNALGPALAVRGASRPLRATAYTMALMELVADKLPFAPDRTASPWLATRVVAGALVARRMVRGRGRAAAGAAMFVGAAMAIATAFTALRLRLAVTRRLGGGPVANAVAGALEDAALLAVGTRLAPR